MAGAECKYSLSVGFYMVYGALVMHFVALITSIVYPTHVVNP